MLTKSSECGRSAIRYILDMIGARRGAEGFTRNWAHRGYGRLMMADYGAVVLLAPRFFLLPKRLLNVPVLRVSCKAGDTPPVLLPVTAVLLLLLRLFENEGLADGVKSA